MSTATGAVAGAVPPEVLLVPGHGRLVLERAWPRPDASVQLELRDPGGRVVGGRWCPDGVEVPSSGTVVRAPGGRAVLHPGGTDPRLPALADDLARSGRLLSHRVGRRAVVRRPDGGYAKHVRPRAVGAVVGGLRTAAEALAGTAVVPRVRTVEPAGVVVLEPLPGRSLLEVGRDEDGSELVAGWTGTGRLLAALHRGRPGLARWRAVDEVRATTRLVDPARTAGLLGPGSEEALAAASETLLALPAPLQEVPLHRDLHDQQVLLHRDSIGLLDCDTAIGGDPAVDVGNLLAHLRLRRLQGLLTPTRAGLAEEALRSARGEAALDPASVRAHRGITLVRLAGLYAWRPRWRHLVPALLEASRL